MDKVLNVHLANVTTVFKAMNPANILPFLRILKITKITQFEMGVNKEERLSNCVIL